MSEDIVAWGILYLIAVLVGPVFFLDSGLKYWQIVVGLNVLVLICLLAASVCLAGLWAIGVVLS